MSSRLSMNDLRSAFGGVSPSAPEIEAEPIAVAKVDLQDLSSAELASLAKISARFLAQASGSDQLRLPRLSPLSDQEICASVERVLGAECGPVAIAEEAVSKEQRMHELLRVIEGMISFIQQQPNRSI
jgi:hypothetical protein